MNISYSEQDRADHEETIGNGATYHLIARDLRRERTGIHGLIAVAIGGRILESDVFNLGRAEDRQRLAKKAHTAMGATYQEAKPLGLIVDDLLNFCLTIMREWERQRFTISEVIEGETIIEPLTFVLEPYVLEHGGSILFAPPGAGKSYISQCIALCIATRNQNLWPVNQRPVLYVNLERARASLERREMALKQALGITLRRSGIQYLHARGASLASVAAKIRECRRATPGLVVFLDSLSRAGVGGLNEDETANRFVDVMNHVADTWFAIGHTPRQNADHLFGSIHFEAGEDIGIRLASERRDNTLGISLSIVKANDLGHFEKDFLALEFENNQLIDIRQARHGEFPDLLVKSSRDSDTLRDYMKSQGEATTTQAAKETGITLQYVSSLFTKTPLYRRVRKEGRNVFYTLADTPQDEGG